MAASMALAGAAGCSTTPPEKIVPYVTPPEEMVPGRPLFFATAIQTPGYGIGLLVESREGRPVKIEGNPGHPASLGATDAFAQASLLDLYDPGRAQTVSYVGRISTWDAFLQALRPRLEEMKTRESGLRILTETIVSPTTFALLQRLLSAFPGARWHQHEPIHRDNSRTGAQLAFGRHVDMLYDFSAADVVVSLESDFLADAPGKLSYARAFATRRRALPGESTLNRLYVLEGSPSITGSMADHRFPIRSSEISRMARDIAEGVLAKRSAAGAPVWMEPLVADLTRARGRSLVLAGEWQPPEVHHLAHRLNAALDNVGKTVRYIPPVEPNPVLHSASLGDLVSDMAGGNVELLVILGGNPVYNAPPDLGFSEAIQRVPLRLHHSVRYEETSEWCHWHIPASHYLETWGDVRAFDGTVAIVQPLIVPLYQSKSTNEVLAALLGDATLAGYEIVRQRWQSQYRAAGFEDFWRSALRQGVVPGSQSTPIRIQPRAGESTPSIQSDSGTSLEIVFRPDPTVWDGRWANNAWLQELPKPLTHLVWDNAALMSADTASQLSVANEDIVEIAIAGRAIAAPVFILPGQASGTVTLHLGYGRQTGQVGTSLGFDANRIRLAGSPWIATTETVRRTGGRYPLVTTQEHHAMEGRPVARQVTAEQYASTADFAANWSGAFPDHESLYPPPESADYAWGMAIDLSRCVGCGSCVIACQAENNVPTVGKSEVANSREMHWLRIDTYRTGDSANPTVLFEPMLCQHCEHAPCEVVCPVEATTHSDEGLNEMTYNRCVGTRYCSNNCPYKVRRFNYFQYAVWDIPQLRLLYNPEVTVRSRGVMEKCTYCVQRINRARIDAKLDDRRIRDGDIVTACQAACPANAIVFGDILDPGSAVSRMKAEPRNYGVLAELNTRPRTTYLARLSNPNPELKGT